MIIQAYTRIESNLTSATALRRPVLLQLATASTLFGSLGKLELALVGKLDELELDLELEIELALVGKLEVELATTRRTFANSLKDRAMLLTSLSFSLSSSNKAGSEPHCPKKQSTIC